MSIQSLARGINVGVAILTVAICATFTLAVATDPDHIFSAAPPPPEAITLDPLDQSRIALVELDRLIQSLPRPDVRDSLTEWLTVGELGLSFQPPPQPYGETSPAGLAVCIVPGLDRPFLLTVDPAWITDPDVSQLAKHMALVHQYVHLRQIRTEQLPAEDFIPGCPLDSNELVHDWFVAEEDAYLAECQLADSLGSGAETEMTRAFQRDGRVGLRRAVAERLQQSPSFRHFSKFIRQLAVAPADGS